MRKNLLFALLLVCAVFGPRVWAANTNSALSMAGLPVVLSVDGDSAAVDELDPGTSATKRAAVVGFDVHGRAVVVLVRIQRASNGLFIDLVGDNTIGEVTTRTTAMNLSGRSHPAAAKDAIDTAILTAAAAD